MYLFAAFLSGIGFYYLFRFFPFLTGIVFLVLSGLFFFNKKYLLTPLIVIGFLYALILYVPPFNFSESGSRGVVIDCLTKGYPKELTSGRWGNKAEVRFIRDAETGVEIQGAKGREIAIISDAGLKKDIHYEILAKTGKDMNRLNPGTFTSERFNVYLEAIHKEEPFERMPVVVWFEGKRDSLTRYLENNFDRDSGALLAAITTGGGAAMSEELKDAFSTSGLAHLLSISGTHFGLFSLLIFGLVRLLIRSMPYSFLQRFTIYLTPSQAAAILSLPFMLMYLLISGASIPALRSFIMINIFLLGLLLGRKGFWLNSLLFAAFLICIWEPASLLNLSFQLSFLAVLFIGLSIGDKGTDTEDNVSSEEPTGRTRHWLRLAKYLKDSILLTFFVSLGTAPLVAYYFHYFSIISPLSNLIITPFIGFVLVAVSLVSAFTFMFSGYYPFHSLVALSAELSVKSVKLSAAIPFADCRVPPFPLIVLVVFYAGIAAYLVLRIKIPEKKNYALILPAVAVVVYLAVLLTDKKGLSVTYLDVGQGDSAIVETAEKRIVIDTGRTGRELFNYLRYLGKKDIDALILTHADGDHSAGAGYLLEKLRVKELWDNGLLIYPDSFKDTLRRSFERGDVITGQGMTIYVLHPYKGFYTFSATEAAEENNNSLVIKVTGEKQTFLFTADTAEEAEEDMLKLGAWMKSDVLKVAHHGSRFSTTEDFLRMVSPEIAVISVGRHNTYGHPGKDTLDRLEGIKVYRTDSDGAIKITETPGGLEVKTYKNFQFERARNISAEWRNIKRLFVKW